MATNSINSTSGPLADVVANLTKRYDTNGDSKLSSDEFRSFLNDFLEGAGGRTNSTFAGGTAANNTNGSSVSPGTNAFGNTANLDPVYLETQIRNAYAKAGKGVPSAEDITYWTAKASTPDIYSDQQVRVGWNAYWEDRILTGSGSSDPRLAGNEGVISSPEQYGWGTSRTTDGRLYFTHLGDQEPGAASTSSLAK